VEIARRKERLRVERLRQRRAVSASGAAIAERAVAARLTALAEFSECRRLVLYSAVSGELGTAALGEWAATRGVPLLWPRIVGEELEFVEAESSERVAGAFGILEPPTARAASALAAGDWVVVPGLAFDASGARLGRGGGFYDRALTAAPEPVRVGVGYDFQCVDPVPVGPLDAAMDWVVTDERVLAARRGAREEL